MHWPLVVFTAALFVTLGFLSAGKAWRLATLAVAVVVTAFILGHFHL